MPGRRDTTELELERDAERQARADEANPEPDDDDDDELAEAEAEPSADPDAEPADTVEQQSKNEDQLAEELGLLMQGFEAGLRDLFGVDEQLVEVPMDGAVGFMLPGALELKAHAKFKRCATCNGHGQVLTGSLAEQQQTADCPRCGGRGYLERLEQEQPPAERAIEPARNGDDDDGFGVPKWMGDPNLTGGT